MPRPRALGHATVHPQLEDLLDKELVFLNDFEWDADAKKWMSWSYFKNVLEGPCGGSIPIARPKNRGGNVLYTADAPVLMTAPRRITCVVRGREVESETQQMDRRIHYVTLGHTVTPAQRQEVTRHCRVCTARLFLEGRVALGLGEGAQPPPQPPPHQHFHGQAPSAASSSGAAPPPQLGHHGPAPSEGSSSSALGPLPKRPRTAADCIQELTDLKQHLDAGALTPEEFQGLKTRLLRGD